MKQIVCANCGAKYKLPDTFKADKAKCKACGSVIDVAGQIAGEGEAEPAAKPAAAKPAKAKPAAAKPARARPATARGGRKDQDAEADTPPRRARAARGAAEDDGEHAARPRRRERVRGAGRTKKGGSNTAVLIGGGIGIVVIAVLLFFVLGGEDPQQTPTADRGTESSQPAEQTPAPPPDATTPAAAEAAGTTEGTPAEATAPKPEPEPAKASEPEPKPAGAEMTKDDVFDPRTDLEELPFPEDMTEAQVEEIRSLVQDVLDGGLPGSRAKDKLREKGYMALAGLTNALRQLDFFDSFDAATGFEINRLMREITKDKWRVPYYPVPIGEEIPLDKAHANALSVKHWQGACRDLHSADAWKAFLERSAKAEDEK